MSALLTVRSLIRAAQEEYRARCSAIRMQDQNAERMPLTAFGSRSCCCLCDSQVLFFFRVVDMQNEKIFRCAFESPEQLLNVQKSGLSEAALYALHGRLEAKSAFSQRSVVSGLGYVASFPYIQPDHWTAPRRYLGSVGRRRPRAALCSSVPSFETRGRSGSHSARPAQSSSLSLDSRGAREVGALDKSGGREGNGTSKLIQGSDMLLAGLTLCCCPEGLHDGHGQHPSRQPVPGAAIVDELC